MSFFLSATALTTFAAAAGAQSFTPVHPPAAPLVTRGPYLNVWLKNSSEILPGTWPQHWDGTVKAMTGLAFIDGSA